MKVQGIMAKLNQWLSSNRPILVFCLIALVSSSIGYWIGRSLRSDETETVKTKKPVVVKQKEDWSTVKDQIFDFDMAAYDVTLVKRSFNDGNEVTYVEYEGGNKSRNFVCSREIHEELVEKFREYLKKKYKENP
jgi:hypothetical protein